MTTLTEGKTPGDWLMFEEDSRYSRDLKTIASGAKYSSGTVLGEISANEKLTACDPAAADGSEVAVAILLNDVDASAADVQAVVISSHARVRRLGLTFAEGISNQAQRDAAMAQLSARGIKQI